MNIDSVGSLQYRLIINDATNNEYSISFENNGRVTWNLSTYNIVDLKNITLINIEILVGDASSGSASATIGALGSQTCAQSGNIIDTLLCLLSNVFSAVKRRGRKLMKRMRKKN